MKGSLRTKLLMKVQIVALLGGSMAKLRAGWGLLDMMVEKLVKSKMNINLVRMK